MNSRTQIYHSASVCDDVEIIVDRWGVPHIYAGSEADMFFGQGFNIARDRLWQLDFWRRRGLGCLSEVFGDKFIERDRAARLFLFRGDWEVEWASYGERSRDVVTSFVDGINFYVDLVENGTVETPMEFREFDYAPARWKPEDVVRIRTHGVFGNLREEVLRAITLRRYGAAVEDIRKAREPAKETTINDGVALDGLSLEVMRMFDLATKPVDFESMDTLPHERQHVKDGSNNWVISAERSETGRPVLANDPHRTTTIIPGLRYLCHLSCPGLDVIGGGEPYIPGISIGHNGKVAFGLTTFSIDQEDMYVLELDPSNNHRYWHKGAWAELRRVEEEIGVRGGQSSVVELLYCSYGPVLHIDQTRHVAYAVKAAWLEPGMAPYLSSIECMRHGTFDNFADSLNGWGAPPLNIVFCDDRNIGWKAVGRAPVRHGWDGMTPVAADGQWEWVRFRQGSELPSALNPQGGYLATSNEMNVPQSHHNLELGFDWFAPYRRERIAEVFEAAQTIPFSLSARLQMDWVSIPARRILTALKEHIDDETFWETEGFAQLRDWNCSLDPESIGACIFEIWYRRHFRKMIRAAALRDVVAEHSLADTLAFIEPNEDLLADARVDLYLVDALCSRSSRKSQQALEQLSRQSMSAAVSELKYLLGPDMETWQWGRLHVAEMVHPLHAMLTPEKRHSVKLGPVPRGGSGDTVGDTAYRSDFVQSGGSTFRLVIDVGEWDNSLAMNCPGQSGDPNSPHFSDLLYSWADGKLFPLLYTRERILECAQQKILICNDDVGNAR